MLFSITIIVPSCNDKRKQSINFTTYIIAQNILLNTVHIDLYILLLSFLIFIRASY